MESCLIGTNTISFIYIQDVVGLEIFVGTHSFQYLGLKGKSSTLKRITVGKEKDARSQLNLQLYCINYTIIIYHIRR